MMRFRVVGAIAGVAVAGALAVSALATDPRQGMCTSTVAAPVRSAIALSRASDYRIHLPKMGISPELEAAVPAYMVVFSGSSTISYAGAPPADGSTSSGPTSFSGIVCVVINGEPIFYVNVDQTGLN